MKTIVIVAILLTLIFVLLPLATVSDVKSYFGGVVIGAFTVGVWMGSYSAAKEEVGEGENISTDRRNLEKEGTMSLGLTLFPVWGGMSMGRILPTDCLVFDYDLDLFSQLRSFGFNGQRIIIDPRPLKPTVIGLYGKKGLYYTVVDERGDNLTYVRAVQLKKLQLSGLISEHNKVILAYIRALPDDTPVILYWTK